MIDLSAPNRYRRVARVHVRPPSQQPLLEDIRQERLAPASDVRRLPSCLDSPAESASACTTPTHFDRTAAKSMSPQTRRTKEVTITLSLGESRPGSASLESPTKAHGEHIPFSPSPGVVVELRGLCAWRQDCIAYLTFAYRELLVDTPLPRAGYARLAAQRDDGRVAKAAAWGLGGRRALTFAGCAAFGHARGRGEHEKDAEEEQEEQEMGRSLLHAEDVV